MKAAIERSGPHAVTGMSMVASQIGSLVRHTALGVIYGNAKAAAPISAEPGPSDRIPVHGDGQCASRLCQLQLRRPVRHQCGHGYPSWIQHDRRAFR